MSENLVESNQTEPSSMSNLLSCGYIDLSNEEKCFVPDDHRSEHRRIWFVLALNTFTLLSTLIIALSK